MVEQEEYEVQIYDLPKPLELGSALGFVKWGFNLRDYLVEASGSEQGYETVCIWGVQGCGKSTRMLQMLHWIYEPVYPEYKRAWREVLKSVIFRPNIFVDTLEAIPDDKPKHAIGWDDIGVHYPSSTFQTDIESYQAIDSTWAAIRTKVHVVILTIPLIDRLAKNLKDNVTFEVFIGKNQVELINRWFRLPGSKHPDSNFFKATIERPAPFDLYSVPKWVWKEYWAMRIELTNEALAKLKMVTKEELEGFISVLDAAEIAFSQGLKYAASTIQQDCSRGIMQSMRVGMYLMVKEDDFIKVVLTKGGYDYRK